MSAERGADDAAPSPSEESAPQAADAEPSTPEASTPQAATPEAATAEGAAPVRPAPGEASPRGAAEDDAAPRDEPEEGPPDEGEPAAAADGPRPAVRRHHGIVRVTHWLNAVLLLGMIASGLQIYGAFRHFGIRGEPYYPNPFDGYTFPEAVRLGGWLAGGLSWHFALAWPFVLTGLLYVGFLFASGEWRQLVFRPRDVPRAWQMQLYYLRLRKEHPPQGKHNALQKAAYTGAVVLGALSVATGFAIYKPVQLGWLTWLFGGFELARYWHFIAVWAFVAFVAVHVVMVFLVDPASLRAIITGWYRGRFPSHD